MTCNLRYVKFVKYTGDVAESVRIDGRIFRTNVSSHGSETWCCFLDLSADPRWRGTEKRLGYFAYGLLLFRSIVMKRAHAGGGGGDRERGDVEKNGR